MSTITIDKIEQLESRIAKLERDKTTVCKILDIYGTVLERMNEVDLELYEAFDTMDFMASQAESSDNA